jgi:hypothetical protein
VLCHLDGRIAGAGFVQMFYGHFAKPYGRISATPTIRFASRRSKNCEDFRSHPFGVRGAVPLQGGGAEAGWRQKRRPNNVATGRNGSVTLKC